VGYDTHRALKDLEAAQIHWREFVDRDCAYAQDTFGQGTDWALSSIQCRIEHQNQRNAVLRAKLTEAQEVKEMLRRELPTALSCP
jgi:uncharacterized protein YecT (DUF1311 family)